MNKSNITWANIKKSVLPNTQMKYCPSWEAVKKKGRPKKDARKLGIADHVKQGVARRCRKNPIVTATIIEKLHNNAAQIRHFDELKLNQLEDPKDGVIGMA